MNSNLFAEYETRLEQHAEILPMDITEIVAAVEYYETTRAIAVGLAAVTGALVDEQGLDNHADECMEEVVDILTAEIDRGKKLLEAIGREPINCAADAASFEDDKGVRA